MKKRILLFLFTCLCVAEVNAQLGFNRVTTFPVNNGSQNVTLPWAGGLNYTQFSQMDLNNDGIKDMVVTDRQTNRISTYLNNNTAGTACWVYAPQYEQSFPVINGWTFLYDYDCDGREDLLTTTFRNNGIMLYHNISLPGQLEFTLIDTTMDAQSPFGAYNIFASSYLVPDFNDIDGDGDMDIITQQFNCVGAYAFYRNRSMEDFGVCDSLDKYELVTNAWGKFALRTGAYPQVAVGQYNINCQSMNPLETQYEVARRDDTFANIVTLDIDGDGDKDALIGDAQTDNSLLVINGGTPGNALMVSQDTAFPSYDVPVRLKSFTSPSFVDADNDGLRDLVYGQSEYYNQHSVWFYKNTGTNSAPVLDFQQTDLLQDQMIDVGAGAAPVFFDENADGLPDLIIGNKTLSLTDSTSTSGIWLYRNTGSSTSPAFTLVTDDYLNLRAQNYVGTLNPAFGDLDQDGDADLLVGLDNGFLIFFRNCAGAGQPANFCQITPNYMSIDAGNAAAPHIVDLKRDGLNDIVIGNKNGILRYYENVGTTGNPFFSTLPTKDTVGQVNVQTPNATDGFADPFFFEYHGSFRAAVACMQGDVYLYGNIDNNVSGTWTLLDTIVTKIYGNRYGYNLCVGGGDINGDSLDDLVIGLYSGGVQIYLQEDSLNSISDVEQVSFQMYPNPANDQLVIKSSRNNVQYRIIDMTGRQISVGIIRGNYAVVPLLSFVPGIYYVSVDHSRAMKLVISR